MDAERHHETASCITATHGPVVISVWRGAINVSDLDIVAKLSDSTRARFPDAHLSLSIASIFVKPPDDAARKRIVELRNSASSSAGFKGSIVVLAGDGFWASLMRSVLAGLNLVGGAPDEAHVRTLAEAAAVAKARIAGVDAADLTRALEKLAADAGVRV